MYITFNYKVKLSITKSLFLIALYTIHSVIQIFNEGSAVGIVIENHIYI